MHVDIHSLSFRMSACNRIPQDRPTTKRFEANLNRALDWVEQLAQTRSLENGCGSMYGDWTNFQCNLDNKNNYAFIVSRIPHPGPAIEYFKD